MKDVTSLSIRELKEELEAYGVDYSACVEKKDLQKLLTKTRDEKGYPPPKTGETREKGEENETKKAKTEETMSVKRIAVLYDPDNHDVRDCAHFIQPFFMNSPEATQGKTGISIAWIMPAAIRDDLISFKLPEQLSNFDWFTAMFVEPNGDVSDFSGNSVMGLQAEDEHALEGPTINRYAHVAQRWNADWILIRRPGGIVGAQWIGKMNACLKVGYKGAYVPGCLLLDAKWHAEQVGAPVVLPSLKPSGAWYYWLLEIYDGLLYSLPGPDEADADADKVMLALDGPQLTEWKEKFAAFTRK